MLENGSTDFEREPGKSQVRAIAIVGVSCRLPGGLTTLDELWGALIAGRDLVTELPPDRFDSSRFLDPNRRRPGKTYTCAGGFLDDVTGFDAEFFEMSPAEASRLDPQQRLLLELAAEAMDDAGIEAQSLAGSDTSVYVGATHAGYNELLQEKPTGINAYAMSGLAMCNTANRISHWYGFQGPSMAIDTACSSSLVALHQACQSLRSGVSRVAFAGGVNVLLSPHTFVGFSKAGMLSPTGRCHAFSAAADGYVRSEGGAVLVLKPLAAAEADGDHVHGVILASGANADGHTRGLSRPSARAQEALLRQVYDGAGVSPDELCYFEAHGTGTIVGDAVECEAVGRALGTRRSTGLPIGSVKSNLGHLEAASGMAGVLKGLLVLRHGYIPASLHALPLNPEIDFAAWRLEPATEARSIPERLNGPAAVVGVNSFGFGGANAHVVLALPAPSRPDLASEPGPVTAVPKDLPLIVSAGTHRALDDVARRMVERLSEKPDDFYDVCYSACRRRSRRRVRRGCVGDRCARGSRPVEGDEPGRRGRRWIAPVSCR